MKIAAYHERFAATVAENIEAGTAPWQKPWSPGESFRPRNLATSKEYRGGNSIFLALAGFGDPRWGTFRQIQTAGGSVLKGSKGTPVVYWGRRRVPVLGADGQQAKDEKGRKVTRELTAHEEGGRPPFAKLYHVFNLAQTSGLDLEPLGAVAVAWTDDGRAERAIEASGVPLTNCQGDRACYSPLSDSITMPSKGQFPDPLAYYHTALHELVHATGHASRIDRPGIAGSDGFGSELYAKEELIAEIGAMMTGEQIGVGSRPQHSAAYVNGWLAALKDDPREIYRAASAAEKAADWIVSRSALASLSKAA